MENRDMNGRMKEAKTAEARIAAVARSLTLRMQKGLDDPEKLKNVPDYADFRVALHPYIERELLLARIDEARKTAAAQITSRVKELALQLAECEMRLPEKDRL
jgi:hypothetical protein